MPGTATGHYWTGDYGFVGDPTDVSGAAISGQTVVGVPDSLGDNMERSYMSGGFTLAVKGDATHKPVWGWWEGLTARVGVWSDKYTGLDPTLSGLDLFLPPLHDAPWIMWEEMHPTAVMSGIQANSYTVQLDLPKGGVWSKAYRSGLDGSGGKIDQNIYFVWAITSLAFPNPSTLVAGVSYGFGGSFLCRNSWSVRP